MKNAKKEIRKVICALLTMAMLCSDAGLTAYAVEIPYPAEQRDILTETVEDEDTSAEDIQLEDDATDSEKTETPSQEDGQTQETPAEETRPEDENGETVSDPETEETEKPEEPEEPAEENGALEENPDGSDGAEDEKPALGAEDSVSENDLEESEKNVRTVQALEDDVIASGEYKENGSDTRWWIDADGKLTVEGTGDYSDPQYHNYDRAPWYSARDSIKYAKVNVTGMTNASCMFYKCTNLISLDMSGFDTSQVTDMSRMFYMGDYEEDGYEEDGYLPDSTLTSLDLSGFNTSKVTDMNKMFHSCGSLTSLDLSSFDTSQVTNMSGMFNSCYNLSALDLSGFNTSRITDMSSMFYNCYKLSTLDLSSFDTSQVTDMFDMFGSCYNLSALDLSGFNTSRITDMSYMFNWCTSLSSLDLSSFETSRVTDMSNMFYFCRSLSNLDLSSFETSQVTDMNNMFFWCSSLSSLDLSGFNTSKVTDMSSMFNSCSSLSSLDLSSFDTSQVICMSGMFDSCHNLSTLDLSGFNTSKVTDMSEMFYNCPELVLIHTPYNLKCQAFLPGSEYGTVTWYDEAGNEYVELPRNISYSLLLKSTVKGTYKENGNDITWTIVDGNLTVEGTGDFSDPQDHYSNRAPWYEIGGSIKHAKINLTGTTNASYMFAGCRNLSTLDLSGFDTSQVTDMSGMFSWCNSLSSLDLSSFDTSQVTDMFGMFSWCNNLSSLDLSSFDTSQVTSMSGMFRNCSSLSSLDLSSFDTSQVTDMFGMFSWCNNLSSLDLSSFDTSQVTSMSGMFRNCSSLSSLDLSSFDTSQVTSMSGMFDVCSSLSSLDLSSFDTSQVTTMSVMFSWCSSLSSLDLSNFDTSQVTSMDRMFFWCSSLSSLDLSSFDTSRVTIMSRMFGNCSSLSSLDLSSFDVSQITWANSMFQKCDNLQLIHTPCNLHVSVTLPEVCLSEKSFWKIPDGTEITELPQNLDHSILISVHYKIALDADNTKITLPDSSGCIYDGNPKTPTVTVVCKINTVSGNAGGSSVTLKQGTDYTVTYENNINAFEDSDALETAQNAPRVIIAGCGRYSGTLSRTFVIRKAAAPQTEECLVEIKDYHAGQTEHTLDLSKYFADYQKTEYTVEAPVEDDTVSGSVISGQPTIGENGILTYCTLAGTRGDFAVIPVTVSFMNYRDALLNVKVVLGNSPAATVTAPVANPESGRQLAAGSKVTLTCETAGAEVYYMTSANGKGLGDPIEEGILYTEPIIVDKELYIRAAAKKGYDQSKAVTFHYTVLGAADQVIKPYADPAQGVVAQGTKITLTCDTPDAVIYYTMGSNADVLGAVPVDEAHQYTQPIEITKDTAVKTVAKKDGMKDSDAAVFVYRVSTPVSAPAADPASGTVEQGSYIALSADSDVNIYYTTDTSDPVLSGTAKLYEGRIRVAGETGSVIVIRAAAERKGVYSETVTYTYRVSGTKAQGLQVMLAGSEEYIYTGRAITPAVIVTNNGEELTEGEDYTVRYSNNVKAADQSARKAPKITVTGKGNLTKSRSITFTIKPKDIGDEEEIVGSDIVTVSGKMAAPVLFYGGEKLTAKDFVNPNAQQKYDSDTTITITGKGNFTGTRDIDVRVVRKEEMKKFTVVIDNQALKEDPLVYDGEEKTLDGYFEVFDTQDKSKSNPLEEYSDYAVIYSKNNTDAGKVKITVVGLGEYYGAVTKSYNIKPRVVKTEADGDMTVNVENGDSYPFKAGGAVIPDLAVACDGDVLVPGKDYKVSYSGNKKVCTNSSAKCTISFKGNYKGSRSIVRKFNISATVLDDVDQITESVSVAVGDKAYTGKRGAYKSVPYVTVNGVLLKSSDYKVSYYKDPDRTQVIDGRTTSSSIDLTEQDNQTVYVKIEGKGNYEGILTAEYNVYKLTEGVIDLTKAKVNFVGGNKAVYTGEGVGPDIEILYKEGKKWEKIDANDIGTYITVTYINNVNRGKATVMINGSGGRYVGSKTAVFNIVAKSINY